MRLKHEARKLLKKLMEGGTCDPFNDSVNSTHSARHTQMCVTNMWLKMSPRLEFELRFVFCVPRLVPTTWITTAKPVARFTRKETK